MIDMKFAHNKVTGRVTASPIKNDYMKSASQIKAQAFRLLKLDNENRIERHVNSYHAQRIYNATSNMLRKL